MAFPVSIVRSPEIVWDSLFVGKITCYPFEEKDYKPYAQASICYHLPKKALAVRMCAFETQPLCTPGVKGKNILKDSTLALHLQLCGEEAFPLFFAAFNPLGQYYATERLEIVKTFEGEDLQGVYWGIMFEIPIGKLSKAEVFDWKSGTQMKGNFYKLCFGDKPHQGSYKQIRDTEKTVLESNEMEDFVLVDY